MNEKIGDHQKDALFKRLLGRAENSTCADCKSKGAAWASLDFGVFVCINCSGVHRSFGMHITRIRSTKLDDWIVGDYKVLETVGNQIANLYWEHGLRGRPDNAIRSEDDRASFIKSKYQSKMWAMKGRKDPVTAYLDSNHTLKTDDLRAMYESGAKAEPTFPKKTEKTVHENGSVRSAPKRQEESLIDFDADSVSHKPPQMEKAKSAVDPFGFDLFGDSKGTAKPTEAPKSQAPAKHHHDFTTSDMMFDFTKTTASYPTPSGHTAVNNGNIYNINNLTVLNQNFQAPSGPSQGNFFGPSFGQTPQSQQMPGINLNHGAHIDRYAVFDTFKLNYQHYNYHG